MGLRWGDNVVEASTATTTGAYQLAGVPSSGEKPGAQTFVSGIGTTNTCYYRAEEVSGTAWESGLGTVTSGSPDTLTRTRIDASSNGGSAVNWTSKTVRISCVLPAYAARRVVLNNPGLLDNATLACSRSSNAETFSLKTAAGADPSAADPVVIAFANTSGGFDIVEVTAALSVTVASGATLGAVNGLQFKVCVAAINNGGTAELTVIGRPSGITDNSVISTTALSGTSNSARTAYSTTARTNVRARVLGYHTYTLTTAGTWNTAPSDILLTRAGAVEIAVKEVLYDVTLTANGVFDTNDWWGSNGFPTTYSALEVVAELRSNTSATSDVAYVFFNGDTTITNYRHTELFGNASTPGSASGNAPLVYSAGATTTANVFARIAFPIVSPSAGDFKEYTSPQYTYRDGSTNDYAVIVPNIWKSTAAINRIQLQPDGYATDNFVSGSKFTLYGVKKMTILT